MFTLVGQTFINMMKTIVPTAKPASGGREVVIRCPFCGDSKDLKHAHFYISVPQTQDELSFYHCKRCPSSGVVNDELLRRIGCSDSNVLVEMIKHNDEVMKLPKYRSIKKIDIYPLKYNYIRNDSANQMKLQYINDRIGSSFTYADLKNMKIFLNLYDVLNQNELELTRHKMVCDDLRSHRTILGHEFVGRQCCTHGSPRRYALRFSHDTLLEQPSLGQRLRQKQGKGVFRQPQAQL